MITATTSPLLIFTAQYSHSETESLSCSITKQNTVKSCVVLDDDDDEDEMATIKMVVVLVIN